MSYVQGTGVRLQCDVSDPATRQPVAPNEIILTIVPPTLSPFQRTRSGGDILAAERPGRFYYVLDTSPEPGTWQYQFEAVGVDTVVERKAITVTKRLNVSG